MVRLIESIIGVFPDDRHVIVMAGMHGSKRQTAGGWLHPSCSTFVSQVVLALKARGWHIASFAAM
jgi:hypothetical protein